MINRMENLKDLIGVITNEVADLIEAYQPELEKDVDIVNTITMSRVTMEFFMKRKEHKRVYYEVQNTRNSILEYLNLI